MKKDVYTKIVLTVIAVNLSILVIKNFNPIQKVHAEESEQYEQEIGLNYTMVPINEDGSITVKLSEYDKIDVNIASISTSDNLEVEVEDVNCYALNSCKIPVAIEEIDSWALSNIEVPVVIEDVDANAFNNCTVPVK